MFPQEVAIVLLLHQCVSIGSGYIAPPPQRVSIGSGYIAPPPPVCFHRKWLHCASTTSVFHQEVATVLLIHQCVVSEYSAASMSVCLTGSAYSASSTTVCFNRRYIQCCLYASVWSQEVATVLPLHYYGWTGSAYSIASKLVWFDRKCLQYCLYTIVVWQEVPTVLRLNLCGWTGSAYSAASTLLCFHRMSLQFCDVTLICKMWNVIIWEHYLYESYVDHQTRHAVK